MYIFLCSKLVRSAHTVLVVVIIIIALQCQPLRGVAVYKAGARLIRVSCRRRHSKHYNNNDDDTIYVDESNIWY